ncbi:MAG: hypothetical protein KAY48_01765 [Saprospiraceae bacterium]|nr:hypothetical protein [Saprospiraceae bacterium]
MKVLVACEESQAVTIAFRAKGHEAFSCDLQPCSGGHPEWHYEGSVFDIINDGWDLMIGHPPCTYLTLTGNRWFSIEAYGDKAIDRYIDRYEASSFFLKLYRAPIEKICLENPIGSLNTVLKPTQIIQPYYFGDEAQKTTCLWLKGLPPLIHQKEATLFDDKVTHVGKGEMVEFASGTVMPKWYADAWHLPKDERSKLRSKTFPGIAAAMADQWG